MPQRHFVPFLDTPPLLLLLKFLAQGNFRENYLWIFYIGSFWSISLTFLGCDLFFFWTISLTFSFVRRLLHNALEESRPKSVLVHSLSICICLLDPKRLTIGIGGYHLYSHQYAQAPSISANPETVESMLENLGEIVVYLMSDYKFDDYLFPLLDSCSVDPGSFHQC